jgi:hypothetical protein
MDFRAKNMDLIVGDIVQLGVEVFLFAVRRRAMITEIDLLKEEIPRLEIKFGRTNAFVELLKAQLVFLQNQTKHQAQNKPYHRPNGVEHSN